MLIIQSKSKFGSSIFTNIYRDRPQEKEEIKKLVYLLFLTVVVMSILDIGIVACQNQHSQTHKYN